MKTLILATAIGCCPLSSAHAQELFWGDSTGGIRQANADGSGTPQDDDTDLDGLDNYLDNDDDGDGVLTTDEDWNGDGDARNDHTDTANHLGNDRLDDRKPTGSACKVSKGRNKGGHRLSFQLA